MVDQKVKICDACKERVAEKSCKICKIDLCRSCSSKLQLKIRVKNAHIKVLDYPLCQTCAKNIEVMNGIKFEVDEKTKDELFNLLRKHLMYHKLKGDNEIE